MEPNPHAAAPEEEDLSKMRGELEELRMKYSVESYRRRIQIQQLQLERHLMEMRMAAMERDMTDKETMQQYAALVKEAAPTNLDSNYVLKLQVQLRKAVERMSWLEDQFNLLKGSCDNVLKSFHDDIADAISERCKAEFELKQMVAGIEEQKRRMESEYEKMMKEQLEQISKLQLEVESVSSPGEVSDEKGTASCMTDGKCTPTTKKITLVRE